MLVPIAERIIAGERVCPGEIRQDGARRIIVADDRRKENIHTKETCNSAKPKDCTHGIGSHRWFADVLTREAHEECTCGNH